MLARNPWSTEFGESRRVRRPGRPADRRGPATGRNFSAAMARSISRRRWPGARRSPIASAPASIPAARCRPGSSSSPTATTEIVFFLGEAATRAEALALIAKYRAADLDAVFARGDRAMGRHPRRGSGEDARSRDGHSAEPLAALSDARLPRLGASGVLPGERRLRLSRSASGRDGAVRVAAGRRRESICCARPRGSSSKATFSIGGFRRRAGASARASPTTASGCRTPSPTMSRSPAIAACSTRRFPFSKGPVLHAGETEVVLSADGLRRARHSVRTLRAGARPESCGRRPRPAADRHGRLERRHEPGRRRRQGREHLARLVPSRHAFGVRAAGGESRRAGARRGLAAACGRACGNRSSAKAGTAMVSARLLR